MEIQFINPNSPQALESRLCVLLARRIADQNARMKTSDSDSSSKGSSDSISSGNATPLS